MSEVLERFRAASDANAIGEIVADAAGAIGFGSLSFASFDPGHVGPGTLVVRSSEFPAEPLKRCLADATVVIDRELGGFAESLLGGPTIFDPIERYSRKDIERSALYCDYWRPYRLEQQVVASMRGGGGTHGFFCLARARQERPFAAADLRAVEQLRLDATHALDSLRGLGSGTLAATLSALSRAFPSPAFLFDRDGKLKWLSDEAVLRLELHAIRVGASTLLRGNAALDAMSAIAVRAHRIPRTDVHRLLTRARLLRPGERATARRVTECGRDLLLVAIEAPPGGGGVAEELPTSDMGPVQCRVARLAAEGYSVTNIAAHLGISESTARTHLRRAYVKLGVHSRAELAFTLLARRRAPAASER